MKIQILPNNKGQAVNTAFAKIGKYPPLDDDNKAWDEFDKANPPLDLTEPNDDVGALVDGEKIIQVSDDKITWHQQCLKIDLLWDIYIHRRFAFHITPVKEGEEKERQSLTAALDKAEATFKELLSVIDDVVATPTVEENKEPFNGLTASETERLAILIEECAEVQQIACKILRHGYESRNPIVAQSPNNRNLLETEVGDLLFAIEWLQQMKDINATKVRYSVIDKKQKAQKYLHHNTI